MFAFHEWSYFLQKWQALGHFALWTLQLNNADEAFLSLILTGVTQRQRVRLQTEEKEKLNYVPKKFKIQKGTV